MHAVSSRHHKTELKGVGLRPRKAFASRKAFVCSSQIILYRCPTCAESLRVLDKHTLKCDNGHTSLRAKEGYVHLLPSGRKAPVNAAGDSPEMVSRAPFSSVPCYHARLACAMMSWLRVQDCCLHHHRWILSQPRHVIESSRLSHRSRHAADSLMLGDIALLQKSWAISSWI